MGSPIYSLEFKEEAAHQVTQLRNSVKDVAGRLGVSTHSLYKWIREIQPTGKQDKELVESKQEIQKLKAELRRGQEERDILI